MSNKISQLKPVTYLAGTEKTVVVQGGANRNVSINPSEIITLAVPGNGDIVDVIPKFPETVVLFNGVITDSFTIQVSDTSNCLPGHRFILILSGDGTYNAKVVTFGTGFNLVQCGGQQTHYDTNAYTNVFTFFFDSVNFTTVDNC